MTRDEERVLRACQEVCRLLAEEALTRIEVSLNDAAGSGRDVWLQRQADEFKRLLDELGTAL